MAGLSTGTLELIALGGPGLVLVLIALAIFGRERSRRRRCTATAEGSLCKYDFLHEPPAPVFEYEVAGTSYTRLRPWRSSVIKEWTTHGDGLHDLDFEMWADDNDCCHLDHGLNYVMTNENMAKALWALGTRMDVHYDPDDPSVSYVETRSTKPSVNGLIVLYTGLGLVALGVVLFFAFGGA
jgi:hypothetical protein